VCVGEAGGGGDTGDPNLGISLGRTLIASQRVLAFAAVGMTPRAYENICTTVGLSKIFEPHTLPCVSGNPISL